VSIQGTNFSTNAADDAVAFNGSAAAVTAASATALTAVVPSGATTGPITVTVAGKSATSAAPFQVVAPGNNPVPSIATLSPCGSVAGSAAFTLTINGSSFVSGSTASFNGTAVTTTYVSASQLTASVPASLIAAAPSGNAAPIVVTSPAPGGGTSPAVYFGVATRSVSLASNVQPVFSRSCTGCHGSGGDAGLNLSSGAAYANLVAVPSRGCSGMRVLACGPLRTQSVLIDKIMASGGGAPCSGGQMPPGGSLSATDQQSIIDWVAQGAPNN
jgi:hypothetical protein